MNVLVLVGSSRAASYNSLLADFAVASLPAGAAATRFDRLEQLPFYDEAAEAAQPDAARDLRTAVASADALVIVTPEFNASVPAVLKNAIDWVSRPREASSIEGKPVAILAATPSPGGAASARRHLADILTRARALPLATTVGIAGAGDAFVGGELVNAEHRDAVAALVNELVGQPVSA